MAHTFAVGQRFHKDTTRPWRGTVGATRTRKGTRVEGIERTTELIRVVAVTHGGFEFEVDEVFNITDAPPRGGVGTPGGKGGMVFSYALELMAQGTLRFLPEPKPEPRRCRACGSAYGAVAVCPQCHAFKSQADMRLDAILSHLRIDAGLDARLEYPGCIVIPDEAAAGQAWWWGTANDCWGGDLLAGDGAEGPIEHLQTEVLSTSTDAGEIALAIQAAMNESPTACQWREEFGPAYAVPAAIWQHPDVADVSWHNDVCPSFVQTGDADADEFAVRLWVNHPEPNERECGPDSPRYGVYTHQESVVTLYAGDDVQAALKALLDRPTAPAPTPEPPSIVTTAGGTARWTAFATSTPETHAAARNAALTNAITLAKVQIATDMSNGKVPPGTATFAALHAYVDANEYGGLCDEQSAAYPFATPASSDEACAFVNFLQDAVDAWLRERATEPTTATEPTQGFALLCGRVGPTWTVRDIASCAIVVIESHDDADEHGELLKALRGLL